MTEQELHRLRRPDLLRLLLAQSRETELAKQQVSEMREQLSRAEETNGRLKERLDDKDAQIEKLQERLDQKYAEIETLNVELEKQRSDRKIELEEAGSIAEATLRLSGIFTAAQEAADLYLENLARMEAEAKTRNEEPDAVEEAELPDAETGTETEASSDAANEETETEDTEAEVSHETPDEEAEADADVQVPESGG